MSGGQQTGRRPRGYQPFAPVHACDRWWYHGGHLIGRLATISKQKEEDAEDQDGRRMAAPSDIF